jgi:hypothetical protein
LELNGKLVEATVDQMRTAFSLSQLPPASLQVAQDEITQPQIKVRNLEYHIHMDRTTMESLIVERMTEDEARKDEEAK